MQRRSEKLARLVRLAWVLSLGCASASAPGDAGPSSDATATCVGDPCEVLAQCGCAADEACDLDRAPTEPGGTRCRAIEGTGDESANCEGSVDCAAGLSCFGETGFFQCRRFCDATDDCASGQCLIEIAIEGDTVPGLKLCTKDCDPTTGTLNGCPEDPQLGCRLLQQDPDGTPGNDDDFYVTDCKKAAQSGGAHDADCTLNQGADCAPGYDCFMITGGGNPGLRCRQRCELSLAETTCSTGSCVMQGGVQPIVDGKAYGICQ